MRPRRQPPHFPIRWRRPRAAAPDDGALLGELLSVASTVPPSVRRRVSVELGGRQPLTLATDDGWRVRVHIRRGSVGNTVTFTVTRAPKGKGKERRALAAVGAVGGHDVETPILAQLVEAITGR